VIISEIGFNHLGDHNIANQYLDVLLQSPAAAVTFQVREQEHRKNKPYRYFKIFDRRDYKF